MLDVNRYGSWQLAPEWNSRWSRDYTQGTQDQETAKSTDNQLRLKLKFENLYSLGNILKNEIAWTTGQLDIQNASELSADQSSYKRNGDYQKVEFNGELGRMLSREAWVTGSVRWHAQWANKNLSVSNRIAYGGTSGIRAYSTADGAADEGVGLFFDVNKRFANNMYFGVLYDVAWLNVAKDKPATTTSPNNYTLQGAGFQLGGEVSKFNWTMSVAKSFGDAQDTSTD
jgi:hemolysin activation/secretion protein